MAAVPLSPDTELRLELLFATEDCFKAKELLITECGSNLPFLEKFDMFDLERYRFAALKLSEGNLKKLWQAVELAQSDWRDLLMATGFGEDVTEHCRWMPHGRAG